MALAIIAIICCKVSLAKVMFSAWFVTCVTELPCWMRQMRSTYFEFFPGSSLICFSCGHVTNHVAHQGTMFLIKEHGAHHGTCCSPRNVLLMEKRLLTNKRLLRGLSAHQEKAAQGAEWCRRLERNGCQHLPGACPPHPPLPTAGQPAPEPAGSMPQSP